MRIMYWRLFRCDAALNGAKRDKIVASMAAMILQANAEQRS